MNIVFLTNILNPYRAKFFQLIANQAQELNFTLHVIAMTGEKADRPAWHYEDFQKEYTILLENKTVLIRGIYLHFNKDIISTLKTLHPDVVICSGAFLQPSVVMTLLNKKRLGYKVYLWSESHLNECRTYGKALLRVRETVRRNILGRFDGFLYAGAYSKEYVDKYKNKDADLYLLHNTVDDHFFYNMANKLRAERATLREKYGFPQDQFVFFSPIRLSREKALGQFFEATADLDPQLKSRITYAVAGIGIEQENWQRIAAQNSHNVVFLGLKNQNEIVELYIASDCFLLPSISDSNPLSVIEASWTGLPLLVSRHVGNWPEIVKVGENGYVFDYNHPEKIEGMIRSLITADKAWKENAATISLDIVKSEYQSDQVAWSLVRHFRDTLQVRND